MKRVFISQPMRGLTKEKILAKRDHAVKTLQEALGDDIEILDSYFAEHYKSPSALSCLAKSIDLLSTADIAYFLDGYENARGCKIEETCAREYGIQRIYEK